jgi:hypothetical protein
VTDATTIVSIASLVVAITALGLTILTYFRSRKSEQIKIARELMDRILEKKDKVDEYLDRFEADADSGYDEGGHLNRINDVLLECKYFGYVIYDSKEITDKNTIRYYKQPVAEIWNDMRHSGVAAIGRIERKGSQSRLYMSRLIKRHKELIESVKNSWKTIEELSK